jgi:hypothetical protein
MTNNIDWRYRLSIESDTQEAGSQFPVLLWFVLGGASREEGNENLQDQQNGDDLD